MSVCVMNGPTIRTRAPCALSIVDAYRYEDPEGGIAVRGLPPGPHLVVVGARDHVGEVRRVVLKEGETRRLDVRLPPR